MTDEKGKKTYNLYIRNGIFYVRLWDTEAGKYGPAKSTKIKCPNKITEESTKEEKAAYNAALEAAEEKAEKMFKKGKLKANSDNPYFKDALLTYWKNRDDLATKYKTESIRYINNAVSPFFQGKHNVRLTDLTPALFHKFMDYLKSEIDPETKQKKYSPRTINRILQLVKTYLNYAYKRDYINLELAGKIEKVKEKKVVRGHLEPVEFMRLVSLDWNDKRIKVAVMLAIFASMRKGEVRALQWGDIDFNNNTISIKRNFVDEYDTAGNPIFKEPKTESARKGRYLIFSDLKNCLLELYNETPFNKPDDLVLVNVWKTNRKNANTLKQYTPMSDTAIKRDFSRMLESIGISREDQRERRLVYHGLRHTFVSYMSLYAGESVVMALSGHGSLRMLENYSHPIEAATVAALEAANRALDEFRKTPAGDDTPGLIN